MKEYGLALGKSPWIAFFCDSIEYLFQNSMESFEQRNKYLLLNKDSVQQSKIVQLFNLIIHNKEVQTGAIYCDHGRK